MGSDSRWLAPDKKSYLFAFFFSELFHCKESAPEIEGQIIILFAHLLYSFDFLLSTISSYFFDWISPFLQMNFS